MRLTIIVFLFFALLASCTPLIKAIYGMKDPNKQVSKESVLKFASKHHLDSVLIAYPMDYDSSFARLIGMFQGIPEVLIFNHKGERVLYKPEDLNCNASVESFIAALTVESNVSIDTTLKLNDVVSLIRTDGGNKLMNKTQPDYQVFIAWARWMGSKNYNEHEKLWIESIRSNANATFNIVCVCCDIIEEQGK